MQEKILICGCNNNVIFCTISFTLFTFLDAWSVRKWSWIWYVVIRKLVCTYNSYQPCAWLDCVACWSVLTELANYVLCVSWLLIIWTHYARSMFPWLPSSQELICLLQVEDKYWLISQEFSNSNAYLKYWNDYSNWWSVEMSLWNGTACRFGRTLLTVDKLIPF